MLRVAIAGFGKMGKIRAKEIEKNPHVQLVAIFEQIDEEELYKYEHIAYCKTYEELLEQDIDAVFICAFNNVLADYTIKALNKGIHVFSEKPPAKSTQELKKVIDAQKKSGKVLKYGFNHRMHYSVMEAKKILQSKKLGKILWTRGIYGKAGSIDFHQNWRNYRKYSGGGILLDQGIHMLDLIYYLTDTEYDIINATLTNSYWDIEVEDNAFITMKSRDNIISTVHSSATQWKHKFLLEICCEEGYINLDGILSSTRSYAPEMMIVGRREFEDITFAMGKPAEQTIWFENDDSWKLELEEFLDAVLHNQPITHGKSEDAYKILELVENIYDKSGFYKK